MEMTGASLSASLWHYVGGIQSCECQRTNFRQWRRRRPSQ
jgi:hypothetical protein